MILQILLPVLGLATLALLSWALPAALVLGVLPYLALAVFLGGTLLQVVRWARCPVPFPIPTTCGQQRSLPWIRSAPWDNPSTRWGVWGRMALEILLFRSLLRNVGPTRDREGRLAWTPRWGLWLGALAFHGALAVVVLRHLRLFEPFPSLLVRALQAVDGFLAVGHPTVQLTTVILPLALLYLAGRRLLSPQLRYLSLASDWLPLALVLAIASTGILLRHWVRTDLVAVREWTLSLVAFQPSLPPDPGWLLPVHVGLVCALGILFPFTKLVHAAGIFLSPTRNLANTSRQVRHVNPWGTPARYRTYAEYEDEFRDRMRAAGLPLERP